MKHRIALWALLGFLVAGGWALYSFSAFPSPMSPEQPLLWNLALLTQPIAFASIYFHFGIRYYWVLLANAGTYALLGLVIESLRRQLTHAA